jgi:hypothetical protein
MTSNDSTARSRRAGARLNASRRTPGLLRGETLSPDAAAFFRCHDAAQVGFGCGTTLAHEAVVELGSNFGTTGGFGVLRGCRQHEAFDI